jgi:hypothetical protein
VTLTMASIITREGNWQNERTISRKKLSKIIRELLASNLGAIFTVDKEVSEAAISTLLQAERLVPIRILYSPYTYKRRVVCIDACGREIYKTLEYISIKGFFKTKDGRFFLLERGKTKTGNSGESSFTLREGKKY